MMRAAMTPQLCPTEPGTDCGSRTGEAIMLGGLAVLIADTVYDIASAPVIAHRKNAGQSGRVVVTPAPIAAGDQPTGYGLSVAGNF